MSNSPPLERLWKLQTKVNMMVLDGKRDPEKVANIYQAILEGSVAASFDREKWYEQDGVIYFSVTSDGTTAEEWIARLESKGFCLSDYAKYVLLSPDFNPTNGVKKVAVLDGMLFEHNHPITSEIRAEAEKRKHSKPNAEIACLIREKFTDKEIEAMGLWGIVVMHEPINDSDSDPSLLYANRDGAGRCLNACYDGSGRRWPRDIGFAFAVSQDGTES